MGQCETCQTDVTTAQYPPATTLYFAEGTTIPKEINSFKEKHEGSISKCRPIQIHTNFIFKGTLDAGNKPTGYGELQGEGAAYFGEFRNGVPEGEGVLVSKDFVYFGGFVKALQEGQGKEHNEGGIFFEGIYEGGQRRKGVLKTKYFTYEGDIVDGYFDGQGVYVEGDTKYIGQFAKGTMNGVGVKETRNQPRYRGRFLNGDYNGYGELEIGPENVYCGQFQRGLPHGFGRQLKNEFQYSGQWVGGKRQGKGIICDLRTQQIAFGEWNEDKLIQ